MKDIPIKSFKTQKDWETWLSKNHEKIAGVWVQFFKKHSGVKSLVYGETLDVALCYGWIDSQVKTYDEKSYIQRFTPRGPKSIWSQKNTEHIARLIKEKKMKPAGLLKVKEAQADGRWERAYASPRNAVIPEDFKIALSKNKKALAFYQTLNKVNTYGFITRIAFAKKEETRKKKIKEFVAMLARGEKLH